MVLVRIIVPPGLRVISFLRGCDREVKLNPPSTTRLLTARVLVAIDGNLTVGVVLLGCHLPVGVRV
jgi:hypothetical protein